MRREHPRRRRDLPSRIAILVGAIGFAVGPTAVASAINGCAPGPLCPSANEDSYVGVVTAPLRVPAPGLLANDDGDPATVVDVANSDSTSMNGARVDVRPDGSFTYTPDPQDPFTGDDSFDYEIQDPQGDSSSSTAYIEVDPIVRDDSYSTPLNTALSVNAPGVFANDIGADTSSVYTGDSAAGATMTVNDDGSFVYQPPVGFKGVDTFDYTVSDGNGDNDFTATVSVGVGLPAPPVRTTPRPKNDPADDKPPSVRVPAPASTVPAAAPPLTSNPNVAPTTSRNATPTVRLPGATTTAGDTRSTSSTVSTASTAHPGTPPGDRRATSATARGASGGSSTPALVAAVLAAVALAGGSGAWWFVRRRRRSTAS